MTHLHTLLVWCAGDVASYQKVKYVFNEGNNKYEVGSITPITALIKKYSPLRALALVPETLFANYEEHRELKPYLTFLKAKVNLNGFRLQTKGRERGREGFKDVTVDDSELRCALHRTNIDEYLIPHPGRANPYTMNVCGKIIVLERAGSREFKGSFERTFSWIFYFLNHEIQRAIEKEQDIRLIVDLTHGTNLMVIATLMASILLKEIYGEADNQPSMREFRVYVAPVMGGLGQGTTVEILDITQSIELIEKILFGIQAWKRMDPGLIDINRFIEAGSHLGPQYKRDYSKVKSLLLDARDALGFARMGQLLMVLKKLESMKDKENTNGRHSEIKGLMSAIGKLDEIAGNELQVTNENLSSLGWYVPTYSALKSFQRFVYTPIMKSGDTHSEQLEKLVEKMKNSDLHDRALLFYREWIVIENIMRDNCLTNRDIVVLDQRRYNCINQRLSEDEEFRSTLDKVRDARNKLAHGGVRVGFERDRYKNIKIHVKKRRVDLNNIENQAIGNQYKKVVENLERLLNKLIEEVKKK